MCSRHDLRHTFASLLIGGGANVVFASRQLGHGSSDVTLRVYAHLFDHAEQARPTREVLQEMVGGVVVSAGLKAPQKGPGISHW